jgi:hypothetical protein
MTPKRDETGDLSPAGAFDKFLMVVAIMGAAVAVLAAVVALRGDTVTAAGAGAGSGEPQVVEYTLSEFTIEGPIEIGAGPTRFQVGNEGSMAHNLTLEGGPSTPDLNAGDTATLDLGALDPGSYVIILFRPRPPRVRYGGDADGGRRGGRA